MLRPTLDVRESTAGPRAQSPVRIASSFTGRDGEI